MVPFPPLEGLGLNHLSFLLVSIGRVPAVRYTVYPVGTRRDLNVSKTLLYSISAEPAGVVLRSPNPRVLEPCTMFISLQMIVPVNNRAC